MDFNNPYNCLVMGIYNKGDFMKVLSLFDGISCGRVALERAGFKVSRYVAFEIDQDAINCSNWNYPDIEHRGSVEGADFTEFKGFDIVMGGFPCTDLSISKNNREGLKGKHSRLFWEQVRAIKEACPKYFLVENNYGMPKADEAIITETLGVEPIFINSALVSAQSRKRLYWTNIPGVKQPEDKGIFLKDIIKEDKPLGNKAYCLTASYDGAVIWNTLERKQRSMIAKPVRVGDLYSNKCQSGRIYSTEGKSVCIQSGGGGMGAGTGLYGLALRTRNKFKKPEARIDGKSNALTTVTSDYMLAEKGNTYKVSEGILYYKEKELPIKLPDGYYQFRKLTPEECECLQTLPEGYTEMLYKSQRYKALGNGWTVDVIAHILNYIHLEELL